MLYDATQSNENITYRFSTSITSIVSNTSFGVTVQLSGSSQPETFDLLVAADGQWSKTRGLCFPSTDVKVRHTGMHAVYFTAPRVETSTPYWSIYLASKRRTVSLRPDPHGSMRAMFTIMPGSPTAVAAWDSAARASKVEQEALLRSNFADVGWETRRLLDAAGEAPDWYFHPISQVKMKGWSKGSVVCLGDAGYAASPLTGMGTSLAIVGAYVLAGEICEVVGTHARGGGGDDGQGLCVREALEKYEARFRPFVEEAQKIPPFVPGVMHPRTEWGRWLVLACMRVVAVVVGWRWVQRLLGDVTNEEDFKLENYDFEGTRKKVKSD